MLILEEHLNGAFASELFMYKKIYKNIIGRNKRIIKAGDFVATY